MESGPTQSTQRILIEQLVVPTLIGVYKWERTQNTNLLMTIELTVYVTDAMYSDNVEHTVNYASVADYVKETASTTSYELLEALGRELCEGMLSRFPIERVTLKIEKPDILPDAKTVSVTMAFEKGGPVNV